MTLLYPTSRFSPSILSNYVESYNCYEFDTSKSSNVFRLYPEGVIEMVFQLGSTILHKTSYCSKWDNRHNAFIGGLHTAGYLIKPQPGTRVLTVRFHPGMAKYFIPADLCHFTNGIFPLTEIWPQKGKELSLQLELAQCLTKQINILQNFLVQQFNEHRQTNIDDTVQLICSKQGLIDLKTLSETARLSTAQFRKRFKTEVGISPKYFARIVRVNAIIQKLIQQPSYKKLGDIAYQFNYFDQSHFIHDFKLVTGISPKVFSNLHYSKVPAI